MGHYIISCVNRVKPVPCNMLKCCLIVHGGLKYVILILMFTINYCL